MSDAPRDPSTDEELKRRRRAAVFGDVLPDTTSDERGEDPDTRTDPNEAWLLRQVPPHHG